MFHTSNLEHPPSLSPRSTREGEEHGRAPFIFDCLTCDSFGGTSPQLTVVLLELQLRVLISPTGGRNVSQANQSVFWGGGCMNQLEEKGVSEIVGSRSHISLKRLEDHFSHHRTETEGKINREEMGNEVGKEHRQTDQEFITVLVHKSFSSNVVICNLFIKKRL